ncbi:unnamed protein product [Angiostrongylus costaricensis]|uniref:Sema domain-containing protein n=1 Tax=Angiostrongylus costaricensis TaxID=334426 RepID=A0A0R3Q0P5_ANGCS|nr:unnamed protein product [Angiostrongylus costaricensis]
MIANDATSSAVVFVGTGPSGNPVLYVGTTFVRGPVSIMVIKAIRKKNACLFYSKDHL